MECSELEKPLKKAKLKNKCSSDRQKSNETVVEILETSSGNSDSFVNEETLDMCLHIVGEIVENCLNLKDPLEKGFELEDGAATINNDVVDIDISEVAVNDTCAKTAETVHEGFETNKNEESIEVSTNSTGQIEQCKEVELLKEGEEPKNTKPTDLTNDKTNNDNNNNNNGCELRSSEITTENAIAIMNSYIPAPRIVTEEEPSVKLEFLSNIDTFDKVCLNPPKLSLIDYPEYDSFMETFPVQEYEKELHGLTTKQICENSNNAVSESLADCCLNIPPVITYYKANVLSISDYPSKTQIAFSCMFSLEGNKAIRRYFKKNNVKFYETTWPQSLSDSEEILHYLETKPFLIKQTIYKATCCLVYKNERCMKLHASEFKTFSQITTPTHNYKNYLDPYCDLKVLKESEGAKKRALRRRSPSSSKDSVKEISSLSPFPSLSKLSLLFSKIKSNGNADFFANQQPVEPTSTCSQITSVSHPLNESHLSRRKGTRRPTSTEIIKGHPLCNHDNVAKYDNFVLPEVSLRNSKAQFQNGSPKSKKSSLSSSPSISELSALPSIYSKIKSKSRRNAEFFPKQRLFEQASTCSQITNSHPLHESHLSRRKCTYRPTGTGIRKGHTLFNDDNVAKYNNFVFPADISLCNSKAELQNGSPKSNNNASELLLSVNEQKNSKWTRFKNLFRKKAAVDSPILQLLGRRT